MKAANAAAPCFIHVDLDDLWAIGECYGLKLHADHKHQLLQDAIPRLHQLFRELDLQATFFVVGRDLEDARVVESLKELQRAGHQFANHSYTHPLNFRSLQPYELRDQVQKAHQLLGDRLGVKAVGFRAPGYGASPALLDVLHELGYQYDSSVMPGPYGWAFRWMDRRLQQGEVVVPKKTQFGSLREALIPLEPHTVRPGLVEIPVATSPRLRLPFQAGACLRLGQGYFRWNLEGYARRTGLPLLFLLHASDVADFSHMAHPFFREPGYFSMPVDQKMDLLRSYLGQINALRRNDTTEDWIPLEFPA